MKNRIKIIKGIYGKKSSISNTTFELNKPLVIRQGVTTAYIDASSIFGKDYKNLEVVL